MDTLPPLEDQVPDLLTSDEQDQGADDGRKHGVVKNWNSSAGWGFVTYLQGGQYYDAYVHTKQIGRKELVPARPVSFLVAPLGEGGQPWALDIEGEGIINEVVCRHFNTTEGCRYGDECHLLHVTEPEGGAREEPISYDRNESIDKVFAGEHPLPTPAEEEEPQCNPETKLATITWAKIRTVEPHNDKQIPPSEMIPSPTQRQSAPPLPSGPPPSSTPATQRPVREFVKRDGGGVMQVPSASAAHTPPPTIPEASAASYSEPAYKGDGFKGNEAGGFKGDSGGGGGGGFKGSSRGGKSGRKPQHAVRVEERYDEREEEGKGGGGYTGKGTKGGRGGHKGAGKTHGKGRARETASHFEREEEGSGVTRTRDESGRLHFDRSGTAQQSYVALCFLSLDI